MRKSDEGCFEVFARDFVRAYWQTVKSGEFPMPPNEPVEETLDELLSVVSYSTEIQPASNGCDLSYKLLMTTTHGDWWHFTFRRTIGGWSPVGCSAPSDDGPNPHDLLGTVYANDFEPFLRHVANVANTDKHI
jgi:hypothetical protein